MAWTDTSWLSKDCSARAMSTWTICGTADVFFLGSFYGKKKKRNKTQQKTRRFLKSASDTVNKRAPFTLWSSLFSIPRAWHLQRVALQSCPAVRVCPGTPGCCPRAARGEWILFGTASKTKDWFPCGNSGSSWCWRVPCLLSQLFTKSPVGLAHL